MAEAFPSKPRRDSFHFISSDTNFRPEAVRVTHSGFVIEADSIGFEEVADYTGLKARFERQGSLVFRLLPPFMTAPDEKAVWFEGDGLDDINFDAFSKQGETISTEARLMSRHHSVHYQDVVLSLRFDGCADAQIGDSNVLTSIWSVTDPVIYPGFKFTKGLSFEPLRSRTRFFELSADMGWIVNFGFQTLNDIDILRWSEAPQ